MCSPVDPLSCIGDGVEAIAGGAIADLADSVQEAYGKVIGSLGTVWVHIGTPNLTASGSDQSQITAGSSAPQSGNITAVMGNVMWIGLAVAILSLMALGVLLAIGMRAGAGIASVGKIGLVLGAVVLISSASALVAGLMPDGPSNAGGAVLFIQSGLWWYMLAAAIVAVVIGGIRMAWERRGEPGRELVKGLLTLIVVAGAGVTTIGLLVAASDAFSVWMINESLGCDVEAAGSACFGENMLRLVALTSNSATAGLGSLLIIILGLVAILAAAFQILLMVARGGMLVILTGILPLSASFTNTEMGQQWFKKCIGWTVAFILYKPAAAIVYATAFQLAGTNVFTDDGSGLLAVLTGLMLMVIALFAMPALMRFVTPMVGAMAGGAGGAMAVGAMAALPTGAAAVGRLGSGGGGDSAGAGGGPGPSGASGPPGDQGSQAPSGHSEPSGASDPAPKDPATSAGSTGAPEGATGTPAPGTGASAAGSSAASGSAAGPGGVVATIALDTAQRGTQAAQQFGEQAAGEGEGGGPDGNR